MIPAREGLAAELRASVERCNTLIAEAYEAGLRVDVETQEFASAIRRDRRPQLRVMVYYEVKE